MCYFCACFVERTWRFGLPLVLAFMPGGFQAIAILGFVAPLACSLLGPAVRKVVGGRGWCTQAGRPRAALRGGRTTVGCCRNLRRPPVALSCSQMGRLLDNIYRPLGLGTMLVLQDIAILLSALALIVAAPAPGGPPIVAHPLFGLLVVSALLVGLPDCRIAGLPACALPRAAGWGNKQTRGEHLSTTNMDGPLATELTHL